MSKQRNNDRARQSDREVRDYFRTSAANDNPVPASVSPHSISSQFTALHTTLNTHQATNEGHCEAVEATREQQFADTRDIIKSTQRDVTLTLGFFRLT